MTVGICLLFALLEMVPFAFGCELSGSVTRLQLSSTPFFSIHNSTLLISWDFRSIPNLRDLTIDSGCVNPSTVVGGNSAVCQLVACSKSGVTITIGRMKVDINRIITPNLASSLIMIDLSKSNFNTHCDVCFLGKDADFYKVLNTKVVFSFDTYCGNSSYNISSDTQLVSLSSGSVACFDCILPGQKRSDMWQVNGKDLAMNINAAGLLIVANSSELFGGLTMAPRLTCGNREYNMSMTALITYTGWAIKTIVPTSAVSSTSVAANTYQALSSKSALSVHVFSFSSALQYQESTTSTFRVQNMVSFSALKNTVLSTEITMPVTEVIFSSTTESQVLSNQNMIPTPKINISLSLQNEDTMKPVLGAVATCLTISIMCGCLVLCVFRSAMKSRQSKRVNKHDISQLKMILVKQATISKISSTFSINTYLDKLESSTQISDKQDLSQCTGDHSTTYENSTNDTVLPFSCVMKSAFGYIGSAEIRTSFCDESHMIDEFQESASARILESHLIGSTQSLCPSEESSVVTNEEPNNSFEKGTLGCCDSDEPATTVAGHYATGDLDMKTERYGANTDGYVASPQIHQSSVEMFDYIGTDQLQHKIVFGYIDNVSK